MAQGCIASGSPCLHACVSRDWIVGALLVLGIGKTQPELVE